MKRIILIGILVLMLTPSTSAWWNTSFDARLKITMNNTANENLTDFPIAVKLNNSNYDYSLSQNNGADIRFIDSDDSTLLSHEIEKWDSSGESIVWIKVPQVNASSSADYIYLYYGNHFVNDTQNATDVWSNGYVGVWHLAEDPSGTAPQILDSTSYGNDGDTQGTMTSSDLITGKIDGSLDLDGTDDWVEVSDPPGGELDWGTSTDFTYSTWVKINTNIVGSYGTLLWKGFLLGAPGCHISLTIGDEFQFECADSSTRPIEDSGGTVNTSGNLWQHITCRVNRSSGYSCYDGSTRIMSGTNVTTSNDFSNGYSQAIGARWTGDRPLNGSMDEVRISNVYRSEAWINASHSVGQDEFVSYGTTEYVSNVTNCMIVEDPCPSGYTKLLGLENDAGGYNNAHSQTASTGTYTYSLCCSSANLVLNATCGEIFLKLSSSTNAHVQQEQVNTYPVDACYDANRGTPSCTYRQNSCSSGEDCLVSMASSEGDDTTNAHVGTCSAYATKVCCKYGNTAPTFSQGLRGGHLKTPLDQDLLGYWKFEGNADDETGNRDGTITGNVQNTSEGRVASAYFFQDNQLNYISTPQAVDPNKGSISIWYKINETPDGNEYLFSQGPGTHNPSLYLTSDDYVVTAAPGGSLTRTSGGNHNEWHHVVATWNTTTLTMYFDGSLFSSTGFSGLSPSGNSIIGNYWSPGSGNNFHGYIDEVIVYNRTLTATEIENLYNETRGARLYTNNDLGGAPENVSDADQDSTTVIYDWKLFNESIALLNMPFDTEVTSNSSDAIKDYSDFGNHGTLGGGNPNLVPTWTPNGIKGGAYFFRDNELNYISTSQALDPNKGSISIWFKYNETPDDNEYIFSQSGSGSHEPSLYMNSGNTLSFAASGGGVQTGGGISYNEWHHIMAIWNTTTLTLYLDNSLIGTDSYNGLNPSGTAYIGNFNSPGPQHTFHGYIDELTIYNRTLTAEQISKIYNNGAPKYNVLVSNETTKGDNWTVEVTINDGTNDSATFESEIMHILNTPPQSPTLSYPINETPITNRSPTFNWTNTDVDGDNFYRIQVALDSGFSSIVIDDNTTSLNYTPSSDLDLDTYYWRVYANDSEDVAAVSSVENFTITSSLVLTLVNNTVEFGAIQAGQTNATDNNDPKPFLLRNDGNQLANVSINATQYFSQAALGTSNYQYKADNYTHLPSLIYNNSAVNSSNGTYINMTFNLSGNDNRKVVVGIAQSKYSSTLGSVNRLTFNGVEMTEIVSAVSSSINPGSASRLYYLDDSELPDAGTYEIALNISEADGYPNEIIAVELNNAKQGTPSNSSGKYENDNNDNIGVLVNSSVSNSMAITICNIGDSRTVTGFGNGQVKVASPEKGTMTYEQLATTGTDNQSCTYSSNGFRRTIASAVFEGSDNTGPFVWSSARTIYTNMNASATLLANYLNYTDSNDEMEIDIRVTVPSGETIGIKESTVQFTGEAS